MSDRNAVFQQLAHQVHLGRCQYLTGGADCAKHWEPDHYTPKDNDIASVLMQWLDSKQVNYASLT